MVALLALIMVAALLIGDLFLERRRRSRQMAMPVPDGLNAPSLELPAGLFLHSGHSWAEVDRSGSLRVGLDELVARAVGRPDRVFLRAPGERLTQGETFLVLERGGRRLSVPSPVSGVVQQANTEVSRDVGLLSESPYGSGWLYRIVPTSLGHEARGLRVAERATQWLQQQSALFAEWVGRHSGMSPGLAMQDGGTPVPGALDFVAGQDWLAFQREFIDGPPGDAGPDVAKWPGRWPR